MRIAYSSKSRDSIQRVLRDPPDFSSTRAIDVSLSSLGFPIVDGTPIDNPYDWYELLTSKKFVVYKGPQRTLDAFLKPVINLRQGRELLDRGFTDIAPGIRIFKLGNQIKLCSNFDSLGRPHRVNRLVNLSGLSKVPINGHLEAFPLAYFNSLTEIGIPVTDIISTAATNRNLITYYCSDCLWDLDYWTEGGTNSNQGVLEAFRLASPPPLQETSLIGSIDSSVKCLDFEKNHLHIIRRMPIMRPGWCSYVTAKPGYSSQDIHGVHCISVFIPPTRFKFSPIIQRMEGSNIVPNIPGASTIGVPVPLVGQIDHAWVTQQTVEDLLWAGYKLDSITFHESIRVQLRPGRTPSFGFEPLMDKLLANLGDLDPVFGRKGIYQTTAGNFNATYTTRDESGETFIQALPTYNPVYYSYIRGKAWSLVFRLTELLSDPINRNPDEVYATDRAVPTTIEGYPVVIKRAVEDFVQFDPYHKSCVGIGDEMLDWARGHKDELSIPLTRDTTVGLNETINSGNLLLLGQTRTRRVEMFPSGGHRKLARKLPRLGDLLTETISASNVTSSSIEDVRKYLLNAKAISRLLEE